MHSLRWPYWKSVQGPPWSEFLGEIYYNCRFLSGCLTGKEKNSEASLSSADPHTALQRPPEELARWGGGNNYLAMLRGWALGRVPQPSSPRTPRFPDPKPSQEAAELSDSRDTCEFRKCSSQGHQ